jgi:general secretion pathway protein F
MPSFRYRALTQTGELVSGTLSASTADEVNRRIEYLGLILVEMALDRQSTSTLSGAAAFFNRPRSGDVTLFTQDLALILHASTRLEDGLELLANDADSGRMRSVAGKLKTSVLAGESFSEAIGHHPKLFPMVYRALVRVGEETGTLDQILKMLGDERARAELLRRKIVDAIQYPLFVLLAAGGVMTFFLFFVLPQFAGVLQDSFAKSSATLNLLLGLSEALRSNAPVVFLIAAVLLGGMWWLIRQHRHALVNWLAGLPIVARFFKYYLTALFCRNLGILLGNGVTLSATLRIVIEIMSSSGGDTSAWMRTAERVRQGSKLSDALIAADLVPLMAVRMLRLGEETGQMPTLATRVAEFYEAKLQRALDRVVGIIGPLAIIGISAAVGGLIVSVMTALLSISELAS